MIKIDNFAVPDDRWWTAAMKGMRNPYKSNGKSDTFCCYGDGFSIMTPDECASCCYGRLYETDESVVEVDCRYSCIGCGYSTAVLGKKDLELLLHLCQEGTSNRKVLRQLPVLIDMKAPLYFWKQLDQYKVGTVTNSESSMHTIMKDRFYIDDFSLCPLELSYDNMGMIRTFSDLKEVEGLIGNLNDLRDRYLNTEDRKKRELVWNHLIHLLPESYNQRRCWTGNYETLLSIIEQRVDHKLPEWRELIITCLLEAPYLREIAIACGFLKIQKDGENPEKLNIMYKDRKEKKWKVLCDLEDTYPSWGR